MSVTNTTGKITFNYSMSETGLFVLGTVVNPNPQIPFSRQYANGLAAVQSAIDLHYEDFGPTGNPAIGRTLAPSATEVYTLSNLTDSFGRTIAFADIRIFCLAVIARTSGDWLTYGPNSVHGWTPRIATGSIKVFSLEYFGADLGDSYPVASGSNDQLVITNAGSHNITYLLGMGGNSA